MSLKNLKPIILFLLIFHNFYTLDFCLANQNQDLEGLELYSSKLMNIQFKNQLDDKKDFLVIAIDNSLSIPAELEEINFQSNYNLANLLKLGIFKGQFGEFFQASLDINGKLQPIILLGTGNVSNLNSYQILKLGGKLAVYFKANKINSVKILWPKCSPTDANFIAEGLLSRSYQFNKYKTEKNNDILTNVTIVTQNASEAEVLYQNTLSIYESIYITRDLATEPANVLTPKKFALLCNELKEFGVDVEIYDEKAIKSLQMNALLAVAQGSSNPPRLVVLKWQGTNKNIKPLALLGKGVTYDSGGLSLKTTEQMDGVKCDMTGAAVVTSVIRYVAKHKVPVNVVGVIGLVENMPDGNAQRPGDIITSMSGQTIEVINTDAEGRLLLADTLWYCQNRFKPQIMIDIATLTGAMIVALGTEYAGYFSNNDILSHQLAKAASQSHEKIWRLPLDPGYTLQLESEVANLQNMGNQKNAGSIVAAEFLQKFVNNVAWVHIDIAGAGWYEVDTDIIPKGASGFGIKSLIKLIESYRL